MYELSHKQAINRGYWTGDPGDDVANVGDLYGVEFEGPIPPIEVQDDAATFVNTDEEIEEAWKKIEGFDLLENDLRFFAGL